MKKEDSKVVRSYIRSSKAYYAKAFPNENINVVLRFENVINCDFIIEWVELQAGQLSAKINSYDDSWNTLFQFKDLLEIMSKIGDDNIQEPEFCKILDSLNIVDKTKYEYAPDLDESELKYLKDKYLNDPFIVKTNKVLNSIYLSSVPIGTAKNTLIYSDEVINLIKKLKSDLQDYIEQFYSKLF